MDRLNWLKISVPLNFISGFLQAGTGIAKIFSDHDLLTNVHLINGLLLVVLILIHLVLNRNWIKMSYFTKKPAA